jgi:hypothetical protein
MYNDDIHAPTYTIGETDTLTNAEAMVNEHISKHKNTKLIDREIEPDKSGADFMYQIGRITLRHYIINKI